MLMYFCAATAALIFLSRRTNKKIANKSRCLFLRRLSIRHKSAQTDTCIHAHVHVGWENGRTDFCINLSAVILIIHTTSRSLVWSYLCLCSLLASSLPRLLPTWCPALTSPELFAHQCTGRFSGLLTITEVFECISVFDLIEQMHFFALGQMKRSKPQYMKLRSAAER